MAAAATKTYTTQGLSPVIHPEDTRQISVGFKAAAANIAKGTVLGQVTATGLWSAYANANVDGTETARGLAVYDMQIDASGKITLSGTASQSGGEQGEKFSEAPVVIAGYYATTDLVGLDAAAITELGKLVEGALADGILRLT